MMVRRQPAIGRAGLSLLEVLIALAIFLFSLVAIARLVDSAVDTAVDMDLRSTAAMLAQSKMAQLVAGAIALNSQGESADEDDPDYKVAIDAQADSIPGLFKVTVTVSRDAPTGRVEVALHQYVLDPSIRGSTDAPTTGSETNGSSLTGGQ